MAPNPEDAGGRPVGPKVQPLPSGRAPERTPIEGAYARLEPADPAAHAESLYRLSHGKTEDAALWTYLAYGPFADQAAFERWLEERSRSSDPLFFAIIDQSDGHAAGMASYLNIAPANGCDRDRPHLVRAAAAADPRGNRGDLSARAPGLRRARLPTPGMEVRRAERRLAARRAHASASPTRAPSAST